MHRRRYYPRTPFPHTETRPEGFLKLALETKKVPFKYHRIMIGHEVVFYIPPKVVVEVDGPVHLKPEVKERDEQTTTDLENVGYKVLRVPNYQTDTLAKAFGVTKRIRKLVGAQQPKS